MKPVHQMVREYRERRGITQVHIAKKTGIDHRRLSQYETGLVRLTADDFLTICLKGFETTPQYFFDEELSEIENIE